MKSYIYAAAVMALTGALLAFGHNRYSAGEAAVQARWDKQLKTDAEAQAERNLTDAEHLRELEGQKNANKNTIATLRSRLAGADRLRLTCSDPEPDQSITDTPAAAGQLSGGVPGGAEEAINQFDIAFREAAGRADAIVEDCRVPVEFYRQKEANP